MLGVVNVKMQRNATALLCYCYSFATLLQRQRTKDYETTSQRDCKRWLRRTKENGQQMKDVCRQTLYFCQVKPFRNSVNQQLRQNITLLHCKRQQTFVVRLYTFASETVPQFSTSVVSAHGSKKRNSVQTISKNCFAGDLRNVDFVEVANALALLFVRLIVTFLGRFMRSFD